ncbi:MAG: DUF3833 family protein [Halioglobus sp.]
MLRTLIITATLLSVLGCASVQVTDYKDARPLLNVEQFFDGQLSAHGVVKDRGGRVIRHFNADIAAQWRDGVGTLTEDFVFDDGEQQRRIWTLTPMGDGRYRGTAGDVIGDAALQQSGNSVFLDYVLRIPYRDSDVDVHVDDRMYLVSPDVLMNESRLTKFGWEVGSLLLVITRQPDKE